MCELFHCSWNSILFESQTLCCRWSTAAMKRRHRWACSPIVGCQLSREGKLFVLLVSTFGCSTLTQYSFVTCFIFWVWFSWILDETRRAKLYWVAFRQLICFCSPDLFASRSSWQSRGVSGSEPFAVSVASGQSSLVADPVSFLRSSFLPWAG